MGKFGPFLAVFIEILFKIYTRVKLKPKNTIWGTFWGTLGIFASVQRLLHIPLCSLFIGSVVEEVDIRKFACRLIDRFESLYYRPTFFYGWWVIELELSASLALIRYCSIELAQGMTSVYPLALPYRRISNLHSATYALFSAPEPHYSPVLNCKC